MDSYKYKAYEEAIYMALLDRCKNSGPNSFTSEDFPTLTDAPAKTNGACTTGRDKQHRLETEWNGRDVHLVPGDMRQLSPDLEKADIFVSELLGSFGDNELSPECLDGAQHLLKENGISIPSSYTSYVAPLQSLRIHQEAASHREVVSPVQF
ncbi:unnamed protein product [Dibothriocephalus latus]|uniref:PRMT5 arginine-N-methyltransferase domain-containing protein n=1 Tax=Dibothriocephalus latus TaxID=60516 RepID=A0A3P7MGR5_DIBLA|nr:unnamed protein product [Dibothriocephalus latus]